MPYLVVIPVILLGIVYLSSKDSPLKKWFSHQKEFIPKSESERNKGCCKHELVNRRQLWNVGDLNNYKDVTCAGNKHVIRDTRDPYRGTICTVCKI